MNIPKIGRLKSGKWYYRTRSRLIATPDLEHIGISSARDASIHMFDSIWELIKWMCKV